MEKKLCSLCSWCVPWCGAVFGVLLSACASLPPPLPPTAHFDEASQSLTVDCVQRIGDISGAPAFFRFSAQRDTAATEQPGVESVRYTLNPIEFVAPDMPPAACRNRAYYGTYPELDSVRMVIPEVLSSSGERYRLELFNPDMNTPQFSETRRWTYDDMLRDVTVTAGATVSIPLPQAYSESSTFYLEHGSGRHSPELSLSDLPGSLDITGVGPGTFDLVAVSDESVNRSHEETMQITVCTDNGDLDDCNSDPDDCDCPAVDQRLTAELAIREALFNYQMSKGRDAGIAEAGKYCLQIEAGRYYSDDQGNSTSPPSFNWHRIYLDPPQELMDRFAAADNVTIASQCERQNAMGVFDLVSGQRAVILISGAITWQGDARVVMEGGYYAHGLSSAGQVITLDRIDGKWQVVQTRGVWSS